MPSLIGQLVAANYRKTGPGSRFGTRELVLAQVSVANTDLTDSTTTKNEDQFNGVTNPNVHAGTSDGNFAKAISAIQTIGEIYAIGEPTDAEGTSEFTVILSADTLADAAFTSDVNASSLSSSDNSNATSLETVLNTLFGQTVNVTYTRLRGFGVN